MMGLAIAVQYYALLASHQARSTRRGMPSARPPTLPLAGRAYAFTITCVALSGTGAVATLTRTEVARHLGVSLTTVRRMEGKQLFPVRDDRGVWRFERSQIEVLIPRRAVMQEHRRSRRPSRGEVAARVFEMLSEGFGLRDIVSEVEIVPSEVRRLYQEWLVSLQEGERQRSAQVAERKQKERDRELAQWSESLRIAVKGAVPESEIGESNGRARSTGRPG